MAGRSITVDGSRKPVEFHLVFDIPLLTAVYNAKETLPGKSSSGVL